MQPKIVDRKTGKVWLRKLQNPTAAEAADLIIGILECLKQYDLVKRHGFLSPNQVFSKSTGLDARLFV